MVHCVYYIRVNGQQIMQLNLSRSGAAKFMFHKSCKTAQSSRAHGTELLSVIAHTRSTAVSSAETVKLLCPHLVVLEWGTRKSLCMPEFISDLLTSVTNLPGRSTLRASSCGNLVVPQTRQQTGDRAFSVAALRAWNRLLTELKLLRSTDLFRGDLKTFLFHSVYGHQDTDWLCDAPSVF